MRLINMKRYMWLRHLWILLAMPLAAGTARIYVNNKAGTTIDAIDPATNKVVQVIENIESPERIRFSPDGSRAYISSGSENVLDVLDRESGKQIKKVPLSGYANDAAVTKDGRLVLVGIHNTSATSKDGGGALDIIDAASLERVKSIPVKSGLHDMEVTPDGKYAVAGSSGGHGSLTVFDLQSGQTAWEVQYDGSVAPITIESGPTARAAGSSTRFPN